MAYDAKIVEIMIASPSDIVEERDIVRHTIATWNSVHARERALVLLPLAWDTHSSPELSGRPQQQINDRILKHADILVGIFWTRAGSPTGKAISGSIEEIHEHHSQGKPVMLYFSLKPVAPDKIDHAQYDQLEKFKAWAKPKGIVDFYENNEDFSNKFNNHLSLSLYQNEYIKAITSKNSPNIAVSATNGPKISPLTDDERALLSAAVKDEHGYIKNSAPMGGHSMYAGGKSFGVDGNVRELARWEAALNGLEKKGLISGKNGKRTVFAVTDLGYRLSETENEF
jgi:hypothetical protein